MSDEINDREECRACGSRELHEFATFGSRLASLFVRSKAWKNYLCLECGAISHFLDRHNVDSYVSYSDSEYRNSISDASQGVNCHKVNQPISLPWSTITSLRARTVAQHLRLYIDSDNSDRSHGRLLDFGGYNGFTAYGLTSTFPDLRITVADLYPKGLKMAAALSMDVVNLANESLSGERSFDFCISLHCLEHLARPRDALISIKNAMHTDGICYFEVPNAFGVPIRDPAHLISFDIDSFCLLIERAGYRILDHGYTSTPFEALDFDYYYSNSKENIFVVCSPLESGQTPRITCRSKHSTPQGMLYQFAVADIRLSFVLLTNHCHRFIMASKTLALSIIRATVSPVFVTIFGALRLVKTTSRR